MFMYGTGQNQNSSQLLETFPVFPFAGEMSENFLMKPFQ